MQKFCPLKTSGYVEYIHHLAVWLSIASNVLYLLSSAKMGYYYHAIVQLGQADVSLLFSQSPGQFITLRMLVP